VDREQLPDVDSLYMNAVMMITGSGGWPMSNFLDPTGRPFHGGTYYPPETFTRAREQALSIHDDFQGGFGAAPKFPQEALLSFLLNQARLNADEESLAAVDFSLKRMAAGGIHDQIGGGFHRYAVDNDWLVPHFEKMLYNQGLLARVYYQAAAIGGDLDHAVTARAILDYVTREMMNPDGLFYSATDADSEGAEGTFFLWTLDKLSEVLNEADAKTAAALWGVTAEGNFEHQAILHRPAPISEIADELNLSVEKLNADRDRIALSLLEIRDTRIRPLRDDKIITEWNALMISAFAEVGHGLSDSGYLNTAVSAAKTLWEKTRKPDGSLWRTQYQGNPSVDGKQRHSRLINAFRKCGRSSGDDEVVSANGRRAIQRFIQRIDWCFLYALG